MGYTVPLSRPVASRMSNPYRTPSATAYSTLTVVMLIRRIGYVATLHSIDGCAAERLVVFRFERIGRTAATIGAAR
jgi:hypothetical protein